MSLSSQEHAILATLRPRLVSGFVGSRGIDQGVIHSEDSMLRVKERMIVEFSRSITLSMLALTHRTCYTLKMVLTNRYTCTPQRRSLSPLRGGPSSRPTFAAPERGVPGDGPWPRAERPGLGRRSERRKR